MTIILTPREFQKNRNIMLSYHNELEEQFNEITRTIPLENDDTVFSSKLYNVLQNSSVQVENMLRLLCDKFELNYGDKRKFPVYYKLLNENNILKIQRIALIKKQDTFYPLEIQDGLETPFWWTAYNKSKHDLPDGFKQGNLKNTIYALGASYAVHCMAYYAQYASKEFLINNRWTHLPVTFTGDGELVKSAYPLLPKSDLFYYSSMYVPRGELPIG
jgi:hypothetical protein